RGRTLAAAPAELEHATGSHASRRRAGPRVQRRVACRVAHAARETHHSGLDAAVVAPGRRGTPSSRAAFCPMALSARATTYGYRVTVRDRAAGQEHAGPVQGARLTGIDDLTVGIALTRLTTSWCRTPRAVSPG